MNNLNDILNIKKIDIEKVIQNVIKETRMELINLDISRMCLVYTSYLYEKLKNNSVLAYIVDTMEDLEKRYQHRFIVIPIDGEKKYVLDLTVCQFGKNEKFKKLELDGYQLLNKTDFSSYIEYVSNANSRSR